MATYSREAQQPDYQPHSRIAAARRNGSWYVLFGVALAVSQLLVGQDEQLDELFVQATTANMLGARADCSVLITGLSEAAMSGEVSLQPHPGVTSDLDTTYDSLLGSDRGVELSLTLRWLRIVHEDGNTWRIDVTQTGDGRYGFEADLRALDDGMRVFAQTDPAAVHNGAEPTRMIDPVILCAVALR